MNYKILDFDEITNVLPKADVLPIEPRPLQSAIATGDLHDLEVPQASNRNLWLVGIALGVGVVGTTVYFLVKSYRDSKKKEKEWDSFDPLPEMDSHSVEDNFPEPDQEVYVKQRKPKPRPIKRRRIYR